MSGSEQTARRSWEFVAIPTVPLLLGLLALVLWGATAGLWVWLALGVVAMVVLVAVALVAAPRPHHPAAPSTPSRPEGAALTIDGGVNRVLVILDDTCAPTDLGASIAGRGGARPTAVLVVAPALGSRIARWTGDEHAYREAEKHLDAVLEALTQLDIDAAGHIGSHDPFQAADAGLREFPADGIVFAADPSPDANWLEAGVVDAARTRYPLPMSELVVAPTAGEA
jgi:hypothetical protein